jgi:hypothetical protein
MNYVSRYLLNCAINIKHIHFMASANLFLDKARAKEKGHPVCIRVCHLRKQWFITLNLSANVKDFTKAIAGTGTLNDSQKELRDTMLQQRQKASMY